MKRRPAILTGQSAAPDLRKALDEAVGRGHADPGLVFVFASGTLDLTQAAEAIGERLGAGPVVGCTTAGEIHFGPYRDGTITVISIAASECVAVIERLDGMGDLSVHDGFKLGARAMANLAAKGAKPSPATCFAMTLVDTRYGNEDVLLTGLRSALGDIPLFGGGAGGRGTFNGMAAVYHDGAFHTDCSALILVSLHRHFKVFSAHHYRPTGAEMTVTRTDTRLRIIEEIDHRPAGLVYAQAVGVDMATLQHANAWLPPLMVKVGSNHYARSAARLDEQGYLHMACPISAGVKLRLGESIGLAENLTVLEKEIRDEVGEPELTLGVECLMRRIEAESTTQVQALGGWFRRNRVVGFCSHGEQFRSMHVNHTFTGIAIGRHRTSPRLRAILSRRDSEIAELEAENQRLRQLVNSLKTEPGQQAHADEDTFNLFKNAVLLEEMVHRRTEELAVANRRLQAELARRRRTEDALRQARQEAIKANESKTQFVAGVSHDMQQPLNATRLLLGRLEHEMLSSRGAKAVQQMESSLQTLETMLTDFFDISKMDAGGYVVSPSTFALGPLLHEVGREFTPQAISRRLDLRVLDASVLVQTDPLMVKRVVRNLVSNALRYTPSGRVLVGVRRHARHASVYVVDTGVGLPEDALKEVFRPYYQLNNPGIVVRRGSGFGLALVERICTLLGVRIQVRSQLGKGSSFSITLPLGRPEDLPPPQDERLAALPPTPLSGARVLVVEDDGAGQEGLLALLDAWGCQALAASCGDEARRLVAAQGFCPDLILSDYHLGMAEADGLSTALEMARDWSLAAPPVIVSSDPDPSLKHVVVGAGALFVTKPIRPARLRAALSSALQIRAKAVRG